jgi:hypothetical protein
MCAPNQAETWSRPNEIIAGRGIDFGVLKLHFLELAHLAA